MNNPEHDIIKEIEWISQNGFDFIDLTIEPPKAHKFDVESVKEKLERYKLKAIGHTNPFLPAIFPLSRIKKACIEEFKECISIFKYLDIHLVNVHPFSYAPGISKEDKVQGNIELLVLIAKLCRDEGMTLMLENGYPIGTPEVFTQVLRKIPSLKIHLDVGHANLMGTDNLTAAFFKEYSDRIIHVHFSDNWGVRDDHLPIGCGSIDWNEVLTILNRYKYNRTVTLEVFSYDRGYLVYSREKICKMIEFF